MKVRKDILGPEGQIVVAYDKHNLVKTISLDRLLLNPKNKEEARLQISFLQWCDRHGDQPLGSALARS